MSDLFLEQYCSPSHLAIKLRDDLAPADVVQFGTKTLLKVPVAPLGEWKHGLYKDVVFSQQDFDDMLSNWRQNHAGYEPPLFLGHPLDTDSMEGAPSYAFLVELAQEGDVLYGLYEPIEPDMFEACPSGGVKVKDVGVFRYSSAEVVLNAKSKADGSTIGTLLVGTALTNRPFIPNLPKPELVSRYTFSDSPDDPTLTFIYGESPAMTTQQSTASEQAVPTPATPTVTTAPAPAPVVNHLSDNLIERITQLADLVTTQNVSIEQLRTDLVNANARIEELEQEGISNSLRSMNVPAAVRDTFSDLILSDAIPKATKQQLMSKLQQLSDNSAETVTTVQGDVQQSIHQQGQNLSDTNESQTLVNPYAALIERNMRLAQQHSNSSTPQAL